MDAIKKALKKFTLQEREWVKGILIKLAEGKTQGLDIKKLQGRSDILRVKKGSIRIVYRNNEGSIRILLIERRSEKTYDL